MSIVGQLLMALVGLVVLARAADRFVDGAVGLSHRFGVSPVIIGAIVIGLGTSLPELLVSVLAAAGGDPSIGVGNVVGSNAANLSLVLGVAAVMTTIRVDSSLLRREAPLSVAAVAAFALALQGGLTRVEGVLLLAALVGALVVIVRSPTGAGNLELAQELTDEIARAPTRRLGWVTLVGVVGTALGAQLLVTGATGVASQLGLSGGFIGVSLVAIGTSLPELVTAAQAARRGEDELIVGNVLGSNVFNSLLVGGAIALVAPGPIDDARLITWGAAAMTAIAALAWALMARRRRITHPEGVALLAGYVVVVALAA